MVQYITVGIISLAIFIIVMFFLVVAGASGRGYQRTTSPGGIGNNPLIAVGGDLCHGSTVENAIAIHDTGLWLIGSTRKLWMTTDIEIAMQYSGPNGGIVIIRVDPGLNLSNQGDGIYTYDIPNALPFGEYYKIEGLMPITVISPQGNRIR